VQATFAFLTSLPNPGQNGTVFHLSILKSLVWAKKKLDIVSQIVFFVHLFSERNPLYHSSGGS
jgi:hypothetical protein